MIESLGFHAETATGISADQRAIDVEESQLQIHHFQHMYFPLVMQFRSHVFRVSAS